MATSSSAALAPEAQAPSPIETEHKSRRKTVPQGKQTLVTQHNQMLANSMWMQAVSCAGRCAGRTKQKVRLSLSHEGRDSSPSNLQVKGITTHRDSNGGGHREVLSYPQTLLNPEGGLARLAAKGMVRQHQYSEVC